MGLLCFSDAHENCGVLNDKRGENLTNVSIRRGRQADAEEAIGVIREAILKLCGDDHHDDEAEIFSWLKNKTISSWNSWASRADVALLVAEQAEGIVGVGMIDSRGEVMLNYIHPAARFMGVSKAIMAALEEYARSRGIDVCKLDSTATAKQFYQALGYCPEGRDALRLYKRL